MNGPTSYQRAFAVEPTWRRVEDEQPPEGTPVAWRLIEDGRDTRTGISYIHAQAACWTPGTVWVPLPSLEAIAAPPEPPLTERYPVGSWWRGDDGVVREITEHSPVSGVWMRRPGGSTCRYHIEFLERSMRLPGPPLPNGWRYMEELPDPIVGEVYMLLNDSQDIVRRTESLMSREFGGYRAWMPADQFRRDHGLGAS